MVKIRRTGPAVQEMVARTGRPHGQDQIGKQGDVNG